MMHLSSPKITFDNRLLAIEEQFRQRKYQAGITELAQFRDEEFDNHPAEIGRRRKERESQSREKRLKL